ncbi:MAG TPA: hypothetical protein VFG22_01535 [Polyangiales bacterium]|nr:hypothetical protein [Polyangiales bacterium]
MSAPSSMSASDAEDLVLRPHRASQSWAQTTLDDRAELLRSLACVQRVGTHERQDGVRGRPMTMPVDDEKG